MKKYFLLVPGAVCLLIAAGLSVATTSANADNHQCFRTIEHDAVTKEVMTDPGQEAIDPVPAQHYVLAGGSWPNDGSEPAFPNPGEPFFWQPNTVFDPHHNPGEPAEQPDGSSYLPTESGLHYTSAGESGHTDWFYFEAGVEGQDAIDPTFETVEVKPAWVEKVRVPCDTDVEGKQETRNPTEVAGVQQRVPGQRIPTQQPAAPAAEVPTAVDAGL